MNFKLNVFTTATLVLELGENYSAIHGEVAFMGNFFKTIRERKKALFSEMTLRGCGNQ